MRHLVWSLALLAAPVLVCSPALAGDGTLPDFSGIWQLDTAKSQTDHSGTITLKIEQTAYKISWERHVRESNGREIVSHFSCDIDGQPCEFDEGDHKAKVSLWFDGSALYVLKTNGPKEDATTEMRLQLSADGKVLNIDFMHLDPNDRTEKRVYNKASS